MSGTIDLSDPVNGITDKIVDAAFKIHRQYGPGLLESAYEHLMVHELIKNYGLKVDRQKTLPIYHEGEVIDAGYRLDLVVEDLVVVELKAVEKMNPVCEAQLITYLKLSGMKVGLLMNFHARLLKDGLKRIVV